MENSSRQLPTSIHLEMKPSQPGPLLRWLDSALRRGLDITVSVLVLIVLGPIFLLIAAAIKHDSPGPVFYHGRRVGRKGKEFEMLKFRTMYEAQASHEGARITAQDDPRITPLGKKLRDSKANELPQFWNVLIGQMGLVGPRPEDPEIVRSWPEEDRRIILSVRPGITSPATVMYRDEESMLSSATVMQEYLKDILPSKMRLDSLYVRNRSILRDLDVIFWTAIALLPNMRRWTVPQHMLYWGPVSQAINRYLSWLVVDSLAALAAVSVAGLIWRLSRPLDVGLVRAALIAAGISLLFSLMNWAFGLNRIEWSRAPASEILKLAVSTSLATAIVIYLNAWNPYHNPLPSAMILVAGILGLFSFAVVRYRERLVTGFASRWLSLRGGIQGLGERVLIVGSGENGALAAWFLGHTSFGRAFSVVGIVDDDPSKQGMRIDGYPVLGTTAAIPELVQAGDIGLILFTIDNIHPLQRARILAACRHTGVRVVLLPNILDGLKKEMGIANKINQDTIPLPQHAWTDEFLDEMQTLLEENQVEAARQRLVGFRQELRSRVNE